MRLRFLVAVLVAFFVGVAPGTTTATAFSFSYDAPAVARVDAERFTPAEASPTQLSGSREAFASLAFEARVISTTPSATFIATEAAGGSLDSSVVYRYVSEGEANAAAKVGRVPNTDVLGQPRSVFYSPDYIDSVAEAEQSLQIGAMNPGGATASPGFRITASPQGAQWTYGGNVAGGSGIEMLTEQALKVLRIDRLPR